VPTAPHLVARTRALAVAATAAVTVLALAGCGDDSTDKPSPRTTAPSAVTEMGPNGDSVPVGGPQKTVLNNQPTSPAANNAPPGSNGGG
jgi:hypothetical protein